ncbi:hypothetical protein AKUG0102_02050 [Apilactobacillus kunkeei]|nr:hypothetical protein AKUG0102_02050 [Apilactobacillus kunkeei]
MFSKELKLAAIKDYYNGLGFTKLLISTVSKGLRPFMNGLGKLNNLELNISQKIQRHIMNIHLK